MRLGEAYLISTRGFLSIDDKTRADIMEIALQEIGAKGKNKYGEHLPDFIIFDPRFTGREIQDGGRSLKIGMKTLSDKVYVKLDDYGSKEILSEQVGHKINTQYVLTFMLSSEY